MNTHQTHPATYWGALIWLTVGFSGACNRPASSADAPERELAPPLKADVAALTYVKHGEAYNPEAPIPSQCYTKTDGVHNPCYVCHQTYDDAARPNMIRDGFQQGTYAFSEEGETNSWTNLFRDRRLQMAAISNDKIKQYINTENYSQLVAWMKSDAWSGVVLELENLPRAAEAFDQHGLAKDGSRWVAFNYKPFPSTFWPTNGSTDDTMIRLPAKFSERDGEFSRDVYYANLSLLEMAITDRSELSAPMLSEKEVGVDLDRDGKLDPTVTRIKRRGSYVGDASDVTLTHMLYPAGTEFLHSVRYIGVSDDGAIYPAPRMKELRYMRKTKFSSQAALRNRYYDEAKEKHYERLPQAVEKGDQGVSNSFGWLLLGFIENERGELRKQHKEEQHFCVGCHKSIGATIDQTFGFPRKVAGAEGWKYIDLRAMTDAPNRNETKGEYLTYFERVGGGDEFRQNAEMLRRWFYEDGRVDEARVQGAKNIYEIIAPSPARAMQLNKAYLVTVQEQSFLFGRDVVVAPATNVVKKVDSAIAPLKPEHRYAWDIRLDWRDPATPADDPSTSPRGTH